MDYTSTINRLLDKSKEAFLMAIEVYNKPSIKYRLEGFSVFICYCQRFVHLFSRFNNYIS